MFTVSPIALEDGLNWRDPRTDLVHIVNYHEHESPWFSSRTGPMGDRAMYCGQLVHVDVDGSFRPGGLISAPFIHTNDMPTCLACIVWTPEVGEGEWREDDQDPLDRDGKA